MAVQYKGIDISKYQADKNGNTLVDFKKLKQKGYTFVMLRAGFGRNINQKDISFESHYKAAKAAGLNVGAYHYSYARSVKEARQEAVCFLNWIKGKKLDYPVVYDLEDVTQMRLGRTLLTDIADAFMSATEKAGYYTMLYTNPDWIENRLDMERLSKYDIWLACWSAKERCNKLYNRPTLGIWQYGTVLHSGIYPSGSLIPKKMDVNISYKNYPAIIKRAGLNKLVSTVASKSKAVQKPITASDSL